MMNMTALWIWKGKFMKVINEAADKFNDKQAEVIEALLDLLRLINEQ